MARIVSVEPGFFRIPLPVVLTDSTHGAMEAFELNTVRIRDAEGGDGVGYTYTVGRNGGAVDALLRRGVGGPLPGEEGPPARGGWQRARGGAPYRGRGGPP